MKKHNLLILVLLVAISCGISSVVLSAPGAAQADRAQSEKNIRKVVLEQLLASRTGDPTTAWKNSAHRTIEFYAVVYDALCENKAIKKQFDDNKITSGKDFFNVNILGTAKHFASLSKAQIEEQARQEAGSPITFTSDQEATLQAKSGAVRVVLENNEWKIDATDSIKESILQLPLTKSGREKIEKY